MEASGQLHAPAALPPEKDPLVPEVEGKKHRIEFTFAKILSSPRGHVKEA